MKPKSNQEWNIKTCQCECKNYRKCKKDYIWNPSACIFQNSKCLKSIDDTSVIKCDKIVSVTDNVSIKMTNTIAGNLPINSDAKKISYKMDCFILHVVFLNIKLLLTIAITCYHYENQVKTKRYWRTDNIKMENNEF